MLALNALQLDWTKKKPWELRCGSRCQHRHRHVPGKVLVVWQPAALAARGLPHGVAHRAAVKRLSKRDVDSSNECLTRPCALAAHTCTDRHAKANQGVVAQGRTVAVPATLV